MVFGELVSGMILGWFSSELCSGSLAYSPLVKHPV